MDRPCEVQALGRTAALQAYDDHFYGHARHECVVERPFMADHCGPHRCSCGKEYAHQASDDGPPLWSTVPDEDE